MNYELIDSGDQKRFERFGDYKIIRPCSIAIWKPKLKKEIWADFDFSFSRSDQNLWTLKKKKPKNFIVKLSDHQFKLLLSDFGHVGIFPEHELLWSWMENKIKNENLKNLKILNLFGYTGACSIALAKTNSFVCHVDASKPMTLWAKENAKLNNVKEDKIRWIVDDVMKFLHREVKRNNTYDAIVLDPPTFGRGPKNEIFKIESDLIELLFLCKKLLKKDFKFLTLSCHTPGYTSQVLTNLLLQVFGNKKIVTDEILIKSKNSFPLPMGSFARIEND
ncbi:MAG: Ribosomal RNA large subunit methyltransferase K [Candidatus Anoxychlamydiales bacterium]|nr:Ribosomal RNA large subunit methyltransferase K [Candidatus Anoxychlamydiales bacterium]